LESPASPLSVSRDFVTISPMPTGRNARDTLPLLHEPAKTQLNIHWWNAPFAQKIWMSNLYYLCFLDILWTMLTFMLVE